MSDLDTAPAAETEIAESAPSISDIIAERHQPQPAHEPHREVGEARSDDAALAELAAKAPTAKPEPKPAATPAPAAQAEIDPATDPKAPKWYRDGLKEANRRAQEAEARLRTTAPAPVAPRAAPELPNPAEDPQGYHEAIERGFTNRMQRFELETNLRVSAHFARQQHGMEKFEDCKAWLSTKPDIEAWAIQQPDPWAAAFTQFTREQLAEEIGDDPNAWREKERQRLRDEILAEQQQERPSAAPPTAPTMQRSAPPAPASTARSAAPRDEGGRFTGPAPLNSAFRNKFT